MIAIEDLSLCECLGSRAVSSSIVGRTERALLTDPLRRGLEMCSSLTLVSLRFFQSVKAVTVPPRPMTRPMSIV